MTRVQFPDGKLCSLLFALCSLLFALCSLLFAVCSLLFAFCSGLSLLSFRCLLSIPVFAFSSGLCIVLFAFDAYASRRFIRITVSEQAEDEYLGELDARFG